MTENREAAIAYFQLNKGVVSQLEMIRNLRSMFGLSLLETKCLISTGSFDFEKLSAMQENLVKEILELENECNGPISP